MPPELTVLPGNLHTMLEEAVRRIVEVTAPEAIALFGSYADGHPSAESDVDLLVVAKTNNHWRVASRLYLLWHDLQHEMPELPPADILVYTPRQFLQALVVGFPAYQVARQGKVLYGKLPERREKMAG